jgi:intracellular multiplication protein IcmK
LLLAVSVSAFGQTPQIVFQPAGRTPWPPQFAPRPIPAKVTERSMPQSGNATADMDIPPSVKTANQMPAGQIPDIEGNSPGQPSTRPSPALPPAPQSDADLPGVAAVPAAPLPSAAQPGAPPLPPNPNELAFKCALQGTLPLTPEQIVQFKKLLELTQKTAIAPPDGPPRPVSRSVMLSLKPGEPSPTIRLYPGNAVALTFSDITGAPWPVNSVTVGNPTAYQVGEAGDKGKTNMVVVSPLAAHATANNLIVTLINHPVPLIFTLETGQSQVDYRLDVTVRARGPNAAYDAVGGSSLSPTSDPVVQQFLDGTPPRDARKLETDLRDVEAWRMHDVLYVRTPFEVLSPAYTGRARNVSGQNLYSMVETPVILVSQDGRTMMVKIGQ